MSISRKEKLGLRKTPFVPVRLTYALTGEPLFRLAAAHSGTPVAALNERPNCNRRDAAQVLFGRAASAAGKVRRLVRLNGKLCWRFAPLEPTCGTHAPRDEGSLFCFKDALASSGRLKPAAATDERLGSTNLGLARRSIKDAVGERLPRSAVATSRDSH